MAAAVPYPGGTSFRAGRPLRAMLYGWDARPAAVPFVQ
jgi:hypothetical protein